MVTGPIAAVGIKNMYWTVKNLDVNKLMKSVVTGYSLTDYMTQLHFAPEFTLEITENWELIDKDEKILDRMIAHANRQACYLHKLIGSQLISVDNQPTPVIFKFDNGLLLRIDIPYDTPELYHGTFKGIGA